MCGGPTSAQTELQQSESDFYKNQIAAYNTAYQNFSQIQSVLNAQFAPILAKGPGQWGYTPEETAAYNTQIAEGTGRNYDQAQRALQENIAAEGGAGAGNVNVTSGTTDQLKEELAAQAAGEQSSEQLGVTTSGYALGRQRYDQAIQGEEALAAGWNPNAFSGSAVNAGNLASSEANTIAQQQNAMWGSVLGALGGVAGSAAGGWGQSGFKKPAGW